ncbi:VOC family protein [Arthrobacter sp. HLT1-20]
MTHQLPQQDQLSADLSMGVVMLKVGDMTLMSNYYQLALGLDVVAEADGGQFLGRGTVPLIHLEPAAGLHLPGRGEAGLFHTALLFNDQASLAATVLSAAQYSPEAYVGSANHLVSEAFYFTDPEGNGIELYWDKPRTEWSWNSGSVVMDTLPLPPNDFLATHLSEESVAGQRQAPAAVGHVHLQVGDVASAEKFYVDTLGFEKTAGWHGQALFVSAGGYHHHMAMNVWNSRGAGPRKDTLGLGEVNIALPHSDDLGALAQRLASQRIATAHDGAQLSFEDPWRNRIRVTVDAIASAR